MTNSGPPQTPDSQPYASNALLLSPLPDGYHFRDYSEDIAWSLHEIEKKASYLFAEHGYPSLAGHTGFPLEGYADWLNGNIVFVAADNLNRPVGYSVASDVGGLFYLKEMAVDPAHGRRGIGRALLMANISRANWAYHPAIALSTFRDVPFNGPFYARHGFIEADVNAVPEEIARQFRSEVPPDVLPSTRMLMIRRL